MQTHRCFAGYRSQPPKYRYAFSAVVLMALMGPSRLPAATAATPDVPGRIAAITEQAKSSPMQTVAEGLFLMGTARTNHGLFSPDLQYDDTEQPQRRVWLSRYEIDRDEVSLGQFLLWLRQQE